MASPNESTAPRRPWNKNCLIGQKPPLKLKEIWSIRIRLQIASESLMARIRLKGLHSGDPLFPSRKDRRKPWAFASTHAWSTDGLR